MFNNAVLDVAIGLIFIYLLYSLLATTINEFIATIFSYRGRMLERGLEQMLDGKNYSYYWWNKLWNYCFNKNGKNPSTILNTKQNLFAANVTNHPLYQRSAEQSWLFKKPAYLSADVFSDILIDVLKPNSSAPTLLKDITDVINGNKLATTSIPLNKDLQKILNVYIDQANGDLQRFKLLIENWYDQTMGRVSGWYKKQAATVLLIIGLCLAMAFNVNTINIVEKLSQDKTAREALVQNASDYIKKNANNFTETKKNGPSAIDTKAAVPSSAQAISSDSAANNRTKGGNSVGPAPKKEDTANKNIIAPDSSVTMADAGLKLKQIDSLYKNNIAQNNTLLGLGWGDYDGHKTWAGKIIYVVWKSIKTPLYLLGFLITAFAISLGAPFWFDLLNKFVNLRASGAKPEDTTSGASKTANLNKRPDPTAKG